MPVEFVQAQIYQRGQGLGGGSSVLIPPSKVDYAGGPQVVVIGIGYCKTAVSCCDLSVNLPNFKPSSREFTPPQHAVTYATHLGTVEYPTVWGSKPTDGQLRLGYANLPPEYAVEFILAYNESFSGMLPVDITDDHTAGITDPTFIERIKNPEGLEWRYAAPPKTNRTDGRLYNVEVLLEATF